MPDQAIPQIPTTPPTTTAAPTTAPGAPSSQVIVSLRGVTKVYGSGDTQVRALDGVDVDFMSGQFTAIMGPSGSGKSTMLHVLAGLDTPPRGPSPSRARTSPVSATTTSPACAATASASSSRAST